MLNRLDPEARYRLLRCLEANPELTQRELAMEMGISLGKVNYCLKALIDKGLVKMGNFRRSRNKKAYGYLLTPKGFREKAQITTNFLHTKLVEYERLKAEIEELRREVAVMDKN